MLASPNARAATLYDAPGIWGWWVEVSRHLLEKDACDLRQLAADNLLLRSLEPRVGLLRFHLPLGQIFHTWSSTSGCSRCQKGRASVGCWWFDAGHSSSSGCDTLCRPSDPPLSILCVAPTLQVSQQGAKQVGVEGAGRGSIQFPSHYPCRPRRETAVAAHIDKILDGIVEPLLDILEGLAALQHDLHHPLRPWENSCSPF